MGAKNTRKRRAWPEYPPGPRAHIYAIGVLSANYNELEETLLYLLRHFSAVPDELMALIFERTPTNVRIALLKKAIELADPDPDIREVLTHFIKAYGVCTNNRGLLVHSRIGAYREHDNAALAAKRIRGTGKQMSYEFPLKLIRRVADEIQYWNRYGSHIYAYLNRVSLSRKRLPKGIQLIGPTTLPGTPPLPDDLLNSFHGKRGKPPIPRSP